MAVGVGVVLIALSFVAACAPARLLFTPNDDYAAYRATRVGATFDDRLAAAASYLDRFPEGDYAGPVRAFYDAAEPAYYAAKRGSISGLEAYLRALPKSPRNEIILIDLRSLRAARDEREELRGVTTMGARLTALSAERARVRTEISAWIRRFLDPVVWERPMSEAPADLIIAWSLRLPAPVCGPVEGGAPDRARTCSKILELPYTVTADGQPEERQATLEIVVVEDALGRPREVSIAGPDLFLRFEETLSARAVTPDDAASKLGAAPKIVELVRNEIEERVGAGEGCEKPRAGSLLLRFACKGIRVTVRAHTPGAQGEAQDDVISIAPL